MRSYELTSPVELKLQHSNPKSTPWIREQNWLFLKLRIFGHPLDSLISPAKLIKHVNVTAICCGLQASKLSPVDRVKHRDIYRVIDIKIYNFYHHSHSLSFNHYQEIFQDNMMATQRWKEKPKLSKWHVFFTAQIELMRYVFQWKLQPYLRMWNKHTERLCQTLLSSWYNDHMLSNDRPRKKIKYLTFLLVKI